MDHVHHLALERDWRQALATGEYRRSTLDRSLDDVGFVHCSTDDQVDDTADRFYADVAEPLVLLTIDPSRLDAPVVYEPGGDDGELFPHVYGPIPAEAVVEVRPYVVGGG